MKKKKDSNKHWLDEVLDEVKSRRGTLIKYRWFIVEVTPSERVPVGNGHGGTDWKWSAKTNVLVSDYFDSEEKAQAFLDEHEPDEGKTLELRREGLFERAVREWHRA